MRRRGSFISLYSEFSRMVIPLKLPQKTFCCLLTIVIILNIITLISMCHISVQNTHTYIFFLTQQPPVGQGLLIHEVSKSDTMTYHSRYDSSGLVNSSSQRPLPDNTQHSQQKSIHAPREIRTHNLSRRAAADLRPSPRRHWD
jgi:hypothetical protein